jgi:amino acid adenylation domain-containing protein
VVADSELAGRLQAWLAADAPPILIPAMHPGRAPVAPDGAGSDLAYILYTSGSTGRPKGVMVPHSAALAFVDWCSDAFQPAAGDRFSAHAPFHFDLSVFDLFVAIKHAATVVLIGEAVARQPRALAALVSRERISVWYSAPSALVALLEHGALERHDLSSLRLVLFAGEVFPVKHLRRLRALLPPRVRLFNLYGPTETNVCTYYQIPPLVPEQRTEPYPIGKACPHFEARVVDADSRPVPRGGEGELLVAGDGTMLGYWGLPERTEQAFALDADGRRFYRTGDLVTESPEGDYVFRGRRDQMVKRRGYRIELGEIEAALYSHPAVGEAAVVARDRAEQGVQICGVLVCREQRPSIVELKAFCATTLPLYMVPDRFVYREALPRTSTGKVDYQVLAGETWISS